jgi:hypothetical protein
MMRRVTGRSKFSYYCLFAVLLSATNLAITTEASAKPTKDRSSEGGKAWGRIKQTKDSPTTETTDTTVTEPVTVTEPNSPPTLSGTPAESVLEKVFYDFVPDSSDPDGDELTFAITSKPGWADFDPTTGALYGTPGVADVGRYDGIKITVTDGQATVALDAFTIDVTATAMVAVTLNWQPPVENVDGTPLLDLAGYRIYYGVDPGNFSNTIELSNPGLSSYVVDNLTPNIWYFAATALNSKGIESSFSSPVIRDMR